ncbi:TolC family protein [Muricauda sp. SCSIO 64092]|uniref:TolC family protein n=1 Tax=Allomuricauda sp. SCSIO 64092 TaxID=2908842 RepID=UPI001FF16777|nr:TolC family protein [Muricauda sp. SCSIO 64092]UOY09048.1 TolC family protein [Muricauda sp. SCSIO 64092]
MNLKHFFFLLLLLGHAQLSAQKVWTLDECVAYAIEHNLQLNDFDLNTQSNKETYRQSVRNLLPIINGFADYSINFGRSINPEDNSFVNTEFFSNNYSLQSSFDLFQGFQKINSIKASKFLYKATKEESLQQKYLLAFRVMSAYYDIQFIEGLITISEEQVQISQTNYDLVKKQVDLGAMAGADLYEAESLLLADKLLLTQNENRLKAAKLTLLQAMNIEGQSDISIQPELISSGPSEGVETMLSDSIFVAAKDFMPSIKAQGYRVKAAKKQLAATRGGLFPSIALQTGIGTGYFETIRDTLGVTIPFRDQIRDNTFRFVGASLNVPIFNGWTSRSRVKQQKIALDRAKNNAKITEQELYQIIQQLVQEHEALAAETAQTQKGMDSQRLAFSIAQKRYERGMINAIELGQAKTLFATAQNQNLQAQLRLRVNNSTLDFYRGLPIFNIN